MAPVNWIIVGAYIAFMLWLGYRVGRSQESQEDYYLGGRSVPYWLVGSSLMANQVSTISLIGAPAFIALREGGGLIWLQYEAAVPLAMIIVTMVLLPAYWRQGGTTIYEYLEGRFGAPARLAMGLIFLVNRSLGAGVILLATSYVTSALLGMGLDRTILLVGAVSLAYTSLGGIRADIYSDLLQLVILWIGSLVCMWIRVDAIGPGLSVPAAEAGRLAVFDVASTGIGDGRTFSFWPMLFGGVFLYVSYYGCDQSQAQRLLATRDIGGAARALALNGIARFPLVLTYCVIGILMIPFLASHPEFAESLAGLPPDYLMPRFFVRYVPDGVLGIIAMGILAASMSSIDSTINSLSAVTWEDFARKAAPGIDAIPEGRKVLLSRLITVAWGIVAIAFAMAMAGRSETVIELINKIGSAFYGPVAGVFLLGVLSRRARGRGALAGLAAGVAFNLVLWFFFEGSVSWMWWNCTGLAATMGLGWILSLGGGPAAGAPGEGPAWKTNTRRYRVLLAWFAVILAACAALERGLAHFLAR